MSDIRGIATLKIHPGRLAEFKELAARCMELARTRDSGTLQYDWFLNGDSTECIVYERYRDSDALVEHVSNLGETMTALFQTCAASGVVLGAPSFRLREKLERAGVRVFSAYQSL